jgi:hypothetical protein
MSIDGTMDLAGDVVVRCYDASAGVFRLGVSLERLTSVKVSVAGTDVVGGPDALIGEAFVLIDDHGRVTGSQYGKDAPAAVRAVLPNVIALLQTTLPAGPALGAKPGTSWEIKEPTMLGVARSRYALRDAAGEQAAVTFDRTRLGYDELLALPRQAPPALALVSRDRVTLTADDVPGHIVVDETVEAKPSYAANVSADLALTAVTTFTPDPRVDADLAGLTPGVRAPAATLSNSEQMLRQLAGNITLERIDVLTREASAGTRMPPGFITAAVAFLKLDPSACADLVGMFEKPTASLATRALLLDLLASAGHERAQAAMREALGSPAARASADGYGTLLQRLGMVLSPEPQTLAFAYDTYTSSKGTVHDAAAFALGATLGARGAANLDPAIDRYIGRLREDLASAKTPATRMTMLAALGNAGSPRDGSRIAALARDDDARVRRQVALSLRKERSFAARSTLFSMLGDPDASVGGAALTSLSDDGVSRDDLTELSALMRAGRVASDLHEPLLSVVGAQTQAYPEQSAAVLRAILDVARDPHTIARAHILLDRCGV